jgi:murein DD-endopeptidase MepM/ murein hydrolase activator NlpD
MGALMVTPLAGWNVRGWSYGQKQDDGQIHPGADFNVGAGDEDLGLPVVATASGRVVARMDWDGRTYGFGNGLLLEHLLPGDLALWSLYGHLDGIFSGAVVGAEFGAGDLIGWCGKTGFQTWAHLHFELRYVGPDVLPIGAWPKGWTIGKISDYYADPFTLLRVLGGVSLLPPADAAPPAALLGRLDELQRDRDYNFGLKMAFEGELRALEGRRRLKRGTVDRLIARAG